MPVLVFSELDGEVLGDGIADTDRTGIPEPGLAGGEFGRAPLIAGRIVEGLPQLPPFGPITWSQHIQPLFRSKCANCHLDGSDRGGYRMDTPTLLRQPGTSKNTQPLVVPFDPENSFLYRKLVDRFPTFGEQMPLATPPLAEHGKELVRRWILEGATDR